MAGINKVIVLGRLGRDPEVRYTQSGAAVANFSIATSENWTDKASGERKERTEWHNVSVFGKMAENCEKYIHKGSQVYVEGKIQTDTYEKDGETKKSMKIIANTVQFLDSKSDRGEPTEEKSRSTGGFSPPANPATSGGFQGGLEPEDDIQF